MAKIDQQVAKAFTSGTPFKSGYTAVEVKGWVTVLMSHGNIIASLNGEELIISSCGWRTATTKARLNGVLDHYHYSIKQVKGEWFLQTMEGITLPFEDGMVISL